MVTVVRNSSHVVVRTVGGRTQNVIEFGTNGIHTAAPEGEEVIFTFDEVRIPADKLLVRIIRHAFFELHEALVGAYEDVLAVIPRNNSDRRINRSGIQRIHFKLINNLEFRIQEEDVVLGADDVFTIDISLCVQRQRNTNLLFRNNFEFPFCLQRNFGSFVIEGDT